MSEITRTLPPVYSQTPPVYPKVPPLSWDGPIHTEISTAFNDNSRLQAQDGSNVKAGHRRVTAPSLCSPRCLCCECHVMTFTSHATSQSFACHGGFGAAVAAGLKTRVYDLAPDTRRMGWDVGTLWKLEFVEKVLTSSAPAHTSCAYVHYTYF